MQISTSVWLALSEREMTLRDCSNSFNIEYKNEIDAGKIRPMTKDFVQRVRSGQFRDFTSRVAKLCEFLDVKQMHSSTEAITSDELRRKILLIDSLIRDDQVLLKKVSRLLDDITDLLKPEGE